MKKIIVTFLTLLLVVFSVSSCKKVISKIFNGVDAEIPETVIIVPASPFPAGTPVPQEEFSLGSFTQSFDLDSTVRANTGGTFGAGDISSVKIKSIAINIIEGADENNNLSNFESARFTLGSTNTNAVQIATFTFPNSYATSQTYVAPSDTPELIGYLKGSQISYNTFARIRRFNNKQMKFGIKVTMTIK